MSIKLTGIVAMDRNGGMGYKDGLPWPRHEEDMKFFRETTIGKPIIMGWNTFKSLGYKPLPKRHNIVLVSPYRETLVNRDDNVTYVMSTAKLIKQIAGTMSKEAFVIGGMKTFELLKDDITEFYITMFDRVYESDVFFNDEVVADYTKKTKIKDIDGGTIYRMEL